MSNKAKLLGTWGHHRLVETFPHHFIVEELVADSLGEPKWDEIVGVSRSLLTEDNPYMEALYYLAASISESLSPEASSEDP